MVVIVGCPQDEVKLFVTDWCDRMMSLWGCC